MLAGDGLLSLAFETMAQSGHPRALAALRELALRCGIDSPRDFVQRFIDYEREVVRP